MSDPSPSETPFSLLVPERAGRALLGIAGELGAMGVLAAQLATRLFPPRIDRYELFRNCHKMGVRSLGIVAATSLFTGAIMVIQAAPLVIRFGANEIIGWGAGYAILREVTPLLVALMFSGRVGANNTAELATMVVTEQLDALRALAIDPISYLILPRAISMVLMLFVLGVFSTLIALVGAVISAELLLEVDPALFMTSFLTMLDHRDFLHGTLKSLAFGAMIALTSCSYGLGVKGGAPGVGRAVNGAVVAAAVGIFVMDYFSTFALR